MSAKWKMIAAGVLVLFLIAAEAVHSMNMYRRGYQAAELKLTKQFAEQLQKQAETAKQASVQYEQAKADSAEKERVRYVEVQKIIREPVYRNVCLDDNGLRTINSAVAER